MDEDSKSGFILPFISDRRVANASMLLEAEAVLSGRTTVKIEDIQAAGIVLCTSDAERVLWDRLFEENVQEYHNQNKTLMNDAQMQQLQTIVDELAGGVLDDKIDVEVAAHTLQVLWLQYQSINPGNDVVAARHESLKGEFITARTTVESRLKKVTGLEDIQ